MITPPFMLERIELSEKYINIEYFYATVLQRSKNNPLASLEVSLDIDVTLSLNVDSVPHDSLSDKSINIE